MAEDWQVNDFKNANKALINMQARIKSLERVIEILVNANERKDSINFK